MPDPALLTPSAYAYLDDLPAFMREDPEVIAVAYALSQENDRLGTFVDHVAANLLPSTADSLTFALWEALFDVQPGISTDVQRSQTLTSRWSAATQESEGASWVEAVTDAIGSNWMYWEHVPGVDALPGRLTIKVWAPFIVGSEEFRRLKSEVEAITDANLAINFVGEDDLPELLRFAGLPTMVPFILAGHPAF